MTHCEICSSSTVTCVALKMLKKVLKLHKVLLWKHSGHVPHAWASPHLSFNNWITVFWKGDESIPLCLLWFWLLLPVLSQVPLLGFTSTSSVCVGEHVGHVNCKQYGFYSRLNLTFVSLIRLRPVRNERLWTYLYLWVWVLLVITTSLSLNHYIEKYWHKWSQWKSSKYPCGKICKGPEKQKWHHSQRNCSI